MTGPVRCVHGRTLHVDCDACDDVGPAFRALDRAGTHARETCVYQQEVRAYYRAGRQDATEAIAPALLEAKRQRDVALVAAMGRGSRARYRRAVVEAIERWDGAPDVTRGDMTGGTWVLYRDVLGRDHQARLDAWDERRQRASRRARAILARLDVEP